HRAHPPRKTGGGRVFFAQSRVLGGSRPVAAEGGGDEQVLEPVVVVAMAVEAFGGTSPALVLACDGREAGGAVRQQGPGPAVEPAGGGRAVQVLAAVEVAVHPAH